MAIIKQTPKGDYHVVSSVEFVKFSDVLSWRGIYRTYKLPDLSRCREEVAVVNVPIRADFSDPLTSFERACVECETCALYGGAIAASPDDAPLLVFERQAAWERVKAERDSYLASGIQTPYGEFDSDLTSILNIVGAAAIATQVGEAWSDQWILKDRSTVTLTRDQLLEVGALLAAFRSQTYRRGDELYRAIQLADTPEAVRAINWHQGLA